MYLIKEVFEKDLDLKKPVKKDVCYKLRRSARALVFNRNKIAVLFAANLNFHKLPGGGIEKNESVTQGLSREILEETGCRISETRELGITIEYRDTIEMLQISYAFKCVVFDSEGKLNFTDKEKDEGFRLSWLTVDEVIDVMRNIDKPFTYAGKFIQSRDLSVLEFYKELFPIQRKKT